MEFSSGQPLYLLEIFADFRAASAAAASRAVAQKLLGSRRAIHLADVHIPLGIRSDYMRPMKLTGLAAASAYASQFSQVLAVEDVDHIVHQIGDIHAALFPVGRKVNRTRRAAD